MAVVPTPAAVSGEAVQNAVNALLKWKDSKSEKSQLLSSDDFVYLVVTLRKIPPQSRTNPYKIPLSHPLYSPNADGGEFCLFLDDRPDRIPTSKDAKAKIAAETIPVTKVIKLSKLKTDYKPFEAKRKLCDSYDMFLADRRIIPLLPKHLGKHFYKKKKIPVPVDLEHKNWKEQVDRLCSSAFLHLKTGTCSTLKVARSSMSVGEIADNVSTAISGVSDIIPKNWRNIRSLHLKLSDSVALPIYQSLPEPDLVPSEKEDIAVALEGKKRGREEEEEEDVVSCKKSPNTSSKKGRIHQVRYMDDQIDDEEQVVAPKTKKSTKTKKSKTKDDAVIAAEKEVVEEPRKSSRTKREKTKSVDDSHVPATKKVKKEANKAELAEADVAKTRKSKKVEVAEADGAKTKKADKAELAEADGAKTRKSKKVEVGDKDGAKTKKADTTGAKKSKRK